MDNVANIKEKIANNTEIPANIQGAIVPEQHIS
jgi:hypothetical protein